MKFYIFIVLFIVSAISVYSQDIPKDFQELLSSGKLTFNPPAGMELKTITSDSLMRYDISYIDSKNNFEIRINILPLDTSVKYRENLDILKISKEGSYKSIEIKPGLFNAEKAGTAEFEFENYYAGIYKYGSVLFLHKENNAIVYVFYLGPDKDTFARQVIDNLFIVKFKK